jgi:hypothetical protein
MAQQSIAWYKECREAWEMMLLWKDAPKILAEAYAKESPMDKNEGDSGEGVGVDDGADDVAGKAVGASGVKAVLDLDDASSSAGAVTVDKGKGRARSKDTGDADSNEDNGKGNADKDDKATAEAVKKRQMIAYDPHDLRVVKELVILPLTTRGRPGKWQGLWRLIHFSCVRLN